MKPKNISIRTKFASVTGIAVLGIWSVFVFLKYSATESLLKIADNYMLLAASRQVFSELRRTHEAVEQTTKMLANSEVMDVKDIETWIDNISLLTTILESNSQSASIYLVDSQGNFYIIRQINIWKNVFNEPSVATYGVDYLPSNKRNLIRYFYNKSLELLEIRELPHSNFNPRTRPWYRDAIASTETITTLPYPFFMGRKVGITVAEAAANQESIIATDIFLDSISQTLKEQRITPSSEMVIHINGNVIAWSGEIESVIKTNDDKLRLRTLRELQSPIFTQIADGINPKGWLVNKDTITLARNISPELIIAIPEHELLADFEYMRIITIIFTFVILFLLVPFIWFVADRLTKPIRQLHHAIKQVSPEDFERGLDVALPEISTNDEVSELGNAMRAMNDSLQDYIRKLASETKSRMQTESELNIAKRIQMDLLPGGGLLSQNIAKDRIYAQLIPAKAVGGDFYELIPLSDEQFFVAVGDVSDKGVPAALFMSRVITLAKLLVPTIDNLSALLSEINNQLASENDSCMFTTLFCGIIDTKNGIINYSSAGHNPPVLVTQNNVQFLDIQPSSPLGLFEGLQYDESVIYLNSGDYLVIYTDGITEAFDQDKNQFSEQRLIETAHRHFETGETLGKAILDAVSKFTQEAPQSDDITLVILGHK
ncbi:MAG: SpoIIE family protein phosphatase [Cyanobacteria bacterium P01_G01_bin.49]